MLFFVFGSLASGKSTLLRERHGRLGSQRDISVPPRVAAAFLAQGDPQRADQLAARAPGLDDVIDVPALGREVRVREAFGVLGDQLAPVRDRVGGRGELAMEIEGDRAL